MGSLSLNSDKCIRLSVCLLIFYANFYAIIIKMMSARSIEIILAISLIIGLIPFLYSKARVYYKHKTLILFWVLFIAEALFNRNQDYKHGNNYLFLRAIFALSMVLFSQYGYLWPKKSINFLYKTEFVHVLATYFFLFIPVLYKIMINIYGRAAIGTNNGAMGYRAGISDHYSQNGTYISFAFLALASFWLYSVTNKKKLQSHYLFLLGATFISLILTTKRAHFLFCILAILIVYFIVNPGKTSGKLFKLFLAFVFLMGILYVLSFVFEPINNLLIRFSTVGEDSQSLSRIRMWKLAWGLFKGHPLIGIGWGGFKYEYAAKLYQSWQPATQKFLNAHNTYVQVLCKTGIIGFFIYIYIAFNALMTTIKGVRACRDRDESVVIVLYMSLLCQVFVLLYNLTGNTLYDHTVFFYAFSVATGLAVCRLEKV